MTLKDADEEQCKLVNDLKGIEKGVNKLKIGLF